MPRYFFHVSHIEPRINDLDGVDLPDQKAAWDEATRACGEMIAQIDGHLAQGSDWHMDVVTAEGPVFEIHFGARNVIGDGSGDELDGFASEFRRLRRRIAELEQYHEMFHVEGLLAVAANEVERVRGSLVTVYRSKLRNTDGSPTR